MNAPAQSRFGLKSLVANAMSMRAAFMKQMMDPRRDIDKECGYPEHDPNAHQLRRMYDRSGIAQRVVHLYPEERWRREVDVRENKDADNTDFETTFKSLQKKSNILYYIQRLDKVSGIGRFGVLLMGVNDGKPLDQPVDGVSPDGTWRDGLEYECLFMRVFDESLVDIAAYQTDPTNPRFGEPTYYNIKFADPTTVSHGTGVNPNNHIQRKVHWSRIVHAADNRVTSEIIGTSRQLVVWNRLLDLRKIQGGNGEMYWKGAFNGVSLESHPSLEDVDLDFDDSKEQLDLYMNGLQRYLITSGMSAKTLQPSVASPEPHFKTALMGITIPLACPYRVFLGSEQASQASTQDIETWRGRMNKTNKDYTGPELVHPVIQRCIDLGFIAPPDKPEDGMETGTFEVDFPDLNEQSDETRIENGAKLTEAVAKYVQSGASELIPELEFLTVILGIEEGEAEAILEAAEKRNEEEDAAEKALNDALRETVDGEEDLRLTPPEGAERFDPQDPHGSNARNRQSEPPRSQNGNNRNQ